MSVEKQSESDNCPIHGSVNTSARSLDGERIQDSRDELWPTLRCAVCDSAIHRDDECWNLRRGQEWHEGYSDILDKSKERCILICPECVASSFCSCTNENPYDLAKELKQHEDVHGVRASERCVTISHAPSERHVEQLPQSVYDHIQTVIKGTQWQPDYTDAGRNAERHKWSGGWSHDPVTRSRDQEAGYELQYHLVK